MNVWSISHLWIPSGQKDQMAQYHHVDHLDLDLQWLLSFHSIL